MTNEESLGIRELDELIERELDNLLSEIKYNKKNYKIRVEDVTGNVRDYEETSTAKEHKDKKEKEDAINGFKKYYRTLNINQSYQLRSWLKKLLLSNIGLNELEEITSRVVSSANGLRNRKDPLRKPK